jgi:hypothetical protein
MRSGELALRSGRGYLGYLCQWQDQVESCAAAGRGLDGDLAAVGRDQ